MSTPFDMTSSAPPLLQAEQLTVDMLLNDREVRIVDQVDFRIERGERVALVGESGSGKSVTAKAIMRLNANSRVSGKLSLDGKDLLGLSEREMARLRGASIGMVFQDPMSALDPLMTIGDQVAETLRLRGVGKAAARKRALAMLDELGVPNAASRLDAYPHEFSGGMRQRVVIAMALVGEPSLLIADEPTTALDVRVQDQVLRVLDDVSRRRGLAVLFITHDLGVVAGFSDRVLVMYSGRIVEDSDVFSTFARPLHPYTEGLLEAIPRFDGPLEELKSIPGSPPHPLRRPEGCAFHPRCAKRFAPCDKGWPPLEKVGQRRVACHLHSSVGADHAA